VLRPEDVLEEIKHHDHPFHSLAEWDDAVAAHQHRLDQIREHIRSVKYVVITETRRIETVHYVRDPALPPDEQGYAGLPRIRTDREKAIEVIDREFRSVEAALVRAHGLAVGLDLETARKLAESMLEQLRRVEPLRNVA